MSTITDVEAAAVKYGPVALEIIGGIAALLGVSGPAEAAGIAALKAILAGIANGDSPDDIKAAAAKETLLLAANDAAADAAVARKWPSEAK